MLNGLRRHASSWLIKTLLTLIILTFILFFGYSSFRDKYLASGQSQVAVIEDQVVPQRKFDLYYQGSLQQFRKQLEGKEGEQDLPEAFQSLLKKNVLNQLVQQAVDALYAKRLGIIVSDDELARSIMTDRRLFPDGHFDSEAYQHNFLPSYEKRYGENFEDNMRQELLGERLNLWAPILFGPWHETLSASLHKTQADQSTVQDKKRKSKKKQDKPDAEATDIESVAPDRLLNLWTNHFQKKIHIDVNSRFSDL